MSKLKGAATGAASGAAAGAVLGPWGAAAGGVIGGIAGYFGSDDAKAPSYTPDHASFDYGLGGSGSYASQQSFKYNQQQQALQALGYGAQDRAAPTQYVPQAMPYEASQGMSYLKGADAQARQQQLAALGGIDRTNQNIQNWADTYPQHSAAQAQLQQGVNAASQQQMAFARAQEGGGGAALRNAAFNAGGISAQAGNQAALIRNQEEQQRLQALGMVQQGNGMQASYAGQLRGADQGFAQAQAGQANYDAAGLNQYNQGQQQLQYQVGQNNLNAQLQARGQNDALTLGSLGQSQQYEVLRNQLASGQLNSQVSYEQAKAQGAGINSANFNAGVQQNNAETGMMLGAMSSAAGAYGQMNGGGGGKPPTSDVRAKEDIKPVSVLEALGGKYSPEQTRQLYMQGLTDRFGKPGQLADAHDRNALYSGGGGFDRGQSEFAPAAADPRAQQLAALGGPTALSDVPRAAPDYQALDAANLRPAQGYEYSYKDPQADGAGRYVGPMAQDLEHLPGVVEQGPDGKKAINAPRLTLANTAAVSELQRKQDAIMAALRGAQPTYPARSAPDYGALDVAYARGARP